MPQVKGSTVKDFLTKYGPTLVKAVGLLGWVVAAALAVFRGESVPPPPILDKPVVPIYVHPTADDDDVDAARDAVMKSGGTPELFHTGWVDQPDTVQAIAAQLPFKVFGDTPAGQSVEELPKSAYLWQIHEQLMARPPPCKNQNPIGSCVSFGTNTAIERTMVSEISRGKQPFQFKHIAEEVTYGGSRVEVGGGRISGDGSVGAWAAQFVQKYGVVPREKIGSYDLSVYDPTRCRAWGRTGVPDDLEQFARQHPVKEITRVASWEEFKRAIANGFGVAICSNVGFTMQRDSRGVCRPSGSWAHCMAGDGYHVDTDGKEYGHIENSWGPNAHTGPVGWGNPTTAGFWAESRVIDRMLKQGDSWAFSAVKGFPARKLDWLIRAEPAAPRAHAIAMAARPCLSLTYECERDRWTVTRRRREVEFALAP
jgi:hypothetical protein